MANLQKSLRSLLFLKKCFFMKNNKLGEPNLTRIKNNIRYKTVFLNFN